MINADNEMLARAIMNSENETLYQTKTYFAGIETISKLLANISVQGFPQPYEDDFQQDFLKKNYVALRLVLFFGTMLYACYTAIDILTLPNWPIIITIRAFITTPMLLVIILLCFTPLYKRYQQLFAVLCSLIIIAGLVTCAALVPAYYRTLFYQSLTLVAFFLTILTALQFRYTLVVCVAVMLAFNISFQFAPMESKSYYLWDLLGNNYVLAGATGLCLVVSYFNELSLRRVFLLNRLIDYKNKLLEYMSRTDQVTGLANRRYLDEIIASEWNRALRHHYPMAVLFADFDYFKQYNDTYGHQAGDAALHSIALVFNACIRRAGDYVGRYGGDEFMVVLSDTNLDDAMNVAKNIMAHLKQLAISHRTSTISNVITLTIGISVLTPTEKNSQNALIKQSDTALQAGKIKGRNNIYIYNEHDITKVDT